MVHDRGYPCHHSCSRANCISIQKASSTWRQMDYTPHWQVCRFHEAHNGRISEAMAVWRTQCTQCFQHVRSGLISLSSFTLNDAISSFIVMASSNEYSRKILNSPTHAEPCLVHSAKAILRPENWYDDSSSYLEKWAHTILVQGFPYR